MYSMRRGVARIGRRMASETAAGSSAAASEEPSLVRLKELNSSQKAVIAELQAELQKLKAKKLHFGEDEASEAMNQRMMQLLAVFAGCSLITLFYQRRSNKALQKGLTDISEQVKDKMTILRKDVKELEAAWNIEMGKKQEQLLQMHQQNNEQTRSIDRLNTAIKKY
eukprot:TRINITY_DN16805_c0_g1_i1.p1 TRINITY_DN16805_c0_g1~~TRINITY_DN16805_c0_g1_i1.p1  ORF type:complete len:167 (+),score=52.27 TRINITY_DN16805_c0_g1_i1:40-540(+)